MSITDSTSIYPNPKTDAQVRANWNRVKRFTDSLDSTLDDHETRLDRLDGGPPSAVFDSNASIGSALYASSSGHVDLADADTLAASRVVGLSLEAVTSTNSGTYQADGFFTLADWTSIIGGATLTTGSRYFLSGTAGQLTVTAPSSGVVVLVGIAISTTTLLIRIEDGIQL